MTAKTPSEDAAPSGWGPTSRRVAANLVRLRQARGLSTKGLSEALDALGQPIPATGITRIEKGQRRVDADDLIALASALKVSPLTLLMPEKWDSAPVELTPGVYVPGQVAWLWGQGEAPAEEIPPNNDEAEHAAYWRRWEEYQALAQPPERRGMGTYMGRALGGLRTEIDRLTHAVRMEMDEGKFDQQVERVRNWLGRLEGEVDHLEAQRRGPKRRTPIGRSPAADPKDEEGGQS